MTKGETKRVRGMAKRWIQRHAQKLRGGNVPRYSEAVRFLFARRGADVPAHYKTKANCVAVAIELGMKRPRRPAAAPVKAQPEKRPARPTVSVARDPRTGTRLLSSDTAPAEADLKAFYLSWEWNQARYGAILASGRVCACCGSGPKDGAKIVVDHIKPIRRFWSKRLDPTNLQVLCEPCNRGKGSWDETDWRDKPKTGWPKDKPKPERRPVLPRVAELNTELNEAYRVLGEVDDENVLARILEIKAELDQLRFAPASISGQGA